MFEVYLFSAGDLNNLFLDLRTVMQDKIRSIGVSVLLKEYKFNSLPDCFKI